MSWTKRQITRFHIACGLAGWNAQQRYVAMAHVGCPLTHAENRPSVSHIRNSQDSYELVMALAESHAASRGANMRKFPQPAQGTWREKSAAKAERTMRLIEAIAFEAVTELPEKFLPNFLSGFVQRMTTKDHGEFSSNTSRPESVRDCDEGQLYRILEGLKEWVGREFDRVDRLPSSFSRNGQRRVA